MTWQGWYSLSLILVILATLITTRVAPDVVMLAGLTLLSLAGVLTPQEALAGFSNNGLMTVAAMFVIASGLQNSGGIDLLINRLLGRPTSIRGAQIRLMLPVAGLSGFMNNTPLVASLIPAVMSWSNRIGVAPSKLLIPVSYAAILGGTLTLIGTSTNLVVNGQYQTLTGDPGFSLFAITFVGLPVAIVGILFVIWKFPKWLPGNGEKQDLFGNPREYTLEVAVAHDGPLVGMSIQAAGLRHLQRIYLVEIERGGTIITAAPSEEILRGGDRLVFAGDTNAIVDLYRIRGIVPSTNDEHPTLSEHRAERKIVEAVISQHSDCVGETIRESRFRDRYGAAVLAVARNGERVAGNLGQIRLQPGDTLLLEARPAFVTRQRHTKDFLLINDLNTETPRHKRAWVSWAILLGVVLAAGTGSTSTINAAFVGAGLMVITGCCSTNAARKSLDLTVIITIGASFALGAALQKTGVAQYIANHVMLLADGRGWLLLLLSYAIVSVLTEIITNNAAALLMLPIVLALAASAGLPAEPFVLATMMAASASFATPIGYQTNLMVYGPGGYKFSDFLRVGVPVNLIAGITSVSVLLLAYPVLLG